MRVNTFTISFLLIISCFRLSAQKALNVQLSFFDSADKKASMFHEESILLDTLQVRPLIQERLNSLYDLGYLATTYYIMPLDSSKIQVDFYAGKVYQMVDLEQGNVSDEIMNKVGFQPQQFKKKPFSHRQLTKIMNSILDYAENHGHPFASVKLDSIRIHKQSIHAKLYYSSGPEVSFDSLIIEGYEKVKPNYLMTHLGIYKGKPYEQKLIDEIPNKIKLLSFLRLNSKPEIQIIEGKCTVKLALSQEKVSQIDGIIGVLPNQKDDSKVLVTGQLMLDLHNLFASGKRIAFEWQSFDAQSQFLNMMYYHPNLFKTPLNIQGGFNLLKQDSTFLNRTLSLELSLITRTSSQIGFKTDFFTSRIISTYGLEGIDQLPENNDFNLNYYGFNYKLSRFNNLNSPSAGWAFAFAGAAGQKKILQNPVIDDSIYNDIEASSLQIKLDGSIDKYWKIRQFLIFRTRILAGYIQGNNLFPGDLYRIGGLNTLRGFTEKSFYCSSFGIANLELRAYLSTDTYFMLFFDQSIIENSTALENNIQSPFGTGIGFSFFTSSGIFNFALALGKSDVQPLAFNYSKIHFGYIARF